MNKIPKFYTLWSFYLGNWVFMFEYKLQDMWFGLYWRQDYVKIEFWITIIPCFPLHVYKIERKNQNND